MALAADAAGIGTPVLVVFTAVDRPHPVLAACTGTAAWLGVRASHRQYAAQALGESRSGLPVLRDWLTLLSLLAVIRVFSGEASEPASALLALSVGPVVTLMCRKVIHRHLTALRREVRSVHRVVVVGEPSAADEVVEHLAARTHHAYVVTGVVLVGEGCPLAGVPAVARLSAERPPAWDDDRVPVLAAAGQLGAELVLVAPGSLLSGERLRRLSWALHDSGVRMALAPGLTDVSPRRLYTATVAGLTLLHIAPPTRRGVQLVGKSALDRVGAALGLLLLAPLYGVLALVIRMDSPGPVLHRQTRMGQGGVPFTMWKFRTMVADADQRREELTTANEQDGPLFKMRRDPRVTKAGRWLRRSSLDELPQLVNVVRGEMSLVGPRPPLPDEAAQYDEVEARRLTVKPGMTGLWQVSGRSDLSWDETVALDLRYADNWSISGDFDVMARTFRAVVDGRGAY
ncbi:sugar transferase [Streptomyces sp. AK02-04a]|uniref:sugar transferase n=1 Tax=Streptomyces sp. AK02-04a TaxID=3028649 RepID=UPI0029A897FB|nr:sugar transferase [Streptomyces sp. AK02-04a]MDX3763031.1 sugar transferase [Streptomyces sp. AK02-04a]